MNKTKKILSTVMFALLLVACVMAFTACGGGDKVDEHVHSEGEWTIIQPADCEHAGIRERKCTTKGCSHTERADIPALGHDLKVQGLGDERPFCEVAGKAVLKCSRCTYTEEAELPAPGHVYPEVKACAEERTCKYCGKVEHLNPTVEHEFSTEEGHENECVNCDYHYTLGFDYRYLPDTDSFEVSLGYSVKPDEIIIPKYHTDTEHGTKLVTHVGSGFTGTYFALKFPDSIVEINGGYNGFAGVQCEFHIPESVKRITEHAFYGSKYCKELAAQSEDGVIFLDGWVLGVNEVVNDYSAGTFTGGTENFVAPEGTRGIIDACFYYTKETIKTAVFNGDYDIPYRCFEGCKLLQSVTLPNCETISYNGFRTCASLTEVTIPDTCKNIGDYAFQDCTNLAEINFNGTLETLGSGVFEKTIYKEDLLDSNAHLYYFGDWVVGFEAPADDAAPFTSVTFKDTTVGIAASALSKSGITSVDIPASIKFIGASAFMNCADLVEADLSEIKITAIPDNMFNGCTKLHTISFPYGLTSFGSAAFKDTGFIYFTVPSTVTSLGNNCFEESSGDKTLLEVQLSGALTALPNECFKGCSSIKEITIPANIKSIGDNCFTGCTGLNAVMKEDAGTEIDTENSGKIIFLSSTPCTFGMNWRGYGYLPLKPQIVVPKGSKDAWLTALKSTETGGGSWADCDAYVTEAA